MKGAATRLARSGLAAALALVAVVNILYLVKYGGGSPAGSPGAPNGSSSGLERQKGQAGSRKELLAQAGKPAGLPEVKDVKALLLCTDVATDCSTQ